MPADNTFRLRRGTVSQWANATDPLKSGEPGYDITNNILKIGDGTNLWNNLKSVIDITGTGYINGNLYINSIPISVSGHNHTIFDILNFNSGVSGLLPVKNIIPGTNISISNNDGQFTINSSGVGSNINTIRGSFVLSSPSSVFNVDGGYNIGSLDIFLNGVKLSSHGDYTASNGTSFTLSEAAPSGSIVEYLALSASNTSSTIINDSSIIKNTGNQTISGSLSIDGPFYATTKSFKIQHPSDPNMFLEYGSLESPYHGIRLTGKDKIINGRCIVNLPQYIKDLIEETNINVQITNYKHNKILYVNSIDICYNSFEIAGETIESEPLEFFWTLTGVRKDIPSIIIEQNYVN